MKKYICSRCGKEIKGNTYYTIDIYGKDINPTNDNRVAFDTATQNIMTNMNKMFNPEKCYCKDCKESIENFIEQKENKMKDLNTNITLEKCLETLSINKSRYGAKGLDMQIFFVGQLFGMSYNDVLKTMKKNNK